MTNPNFSVFNHKNILLTGHTGFKGSWLSIWLLLHNADLVGYALEPKTQYDNYILSSLSSKLKEYIADIRDKDKIFEVVNIEKPEIIFHLAAQPLVLESYKNPLYTIETNVIGTANILEAFRHSQSAKLLVIITTDKVYENRDLNHPFNENDRLGGKDTYSSSKAAAELISKAYQESFFQDKEKIVVTVRAGNVIGGGDWSEHRIIPDCIKAIENDQNIIVRNPYFVRPWQFVLEPLGGYLLLASKILNGEKHLAGAWNFGPTNNSTLNVIELVQLLINHYGKGSYEVKRDDSSMKEATYLSLDISKARKELNWNPCLTIDEAVRLTVDWYKHYKTENIFDFCCKQIAEYEKKWKSESLN